jgi:uncharacterized phage infection (PIP) family protein YhgE
VSDEQKQAITEVSEGLLKACQGFVESAALMVEMAESFQRSAEAMASFTRQINLFAESLPGENDDADTDEAE